MNVLLIGSGGREHALAWALNASPLLTKLYAAPGNGGICETAECVDLNIKDHQAVCTFCKDNNVELVIVGPEAPLVDGLGDDLEQAGIKVFGPSKAASLLEGSKRFTKELCKEHGIPTAEYAHFNNAQDAKDYVKEKGTPLVIKADGLAAGKGVIIAFTEFEAMLGIDHCFGGRFGFAGEEVVIEELMKGEEVSFFCLVDGETVLPLAAVQDHKRAFDNDEGPNTGGMGAYSPATVMSKALFDRTLEDIINPTVRAMKERGTPFKGVLFAGLMITEEGPKLIEYNVRFGDPETQPLVMRMKSDLLEALNAAATGTLADIKMQWHNERALTVVMVSKGYPGDYDTGSEIKGIEDAASDPDVQIFHSGTKRDGDKIISNGGRVLSITARGNSVSDAQTKAYAAVDKIDWPGGYCRRDIGWRAIARERPKDS